MKSLEQLYLEYREKQKQKEERSAINREKRRVARERRKAEEAERIKEKKFSMENVSLILLLDFYGRENVAKWLNVTEGHIDKSLSYDARFKTRNNDLWGVLMANVMGIYSVAINCKEGLRDKKNPPGIPLVMDHVIYPPIVEEQVRMKRDLLSGMFVGVWRYYNRDEYTVEAGKVMVCDYQVKTDIVKVIRDQYQSLF